VSYEHSGERERYSESEDRESTEDHEREESPEDMSSEAAEDLEREEEAERAADKASRELDEMESDASEAKDIADDASRELDQEEQSMEGDLGHDLHETRDDLHDRFVNDMERQLDGPSHKESEVDEQGESGSSSDETESSESYHDAGDGMAYATRTEGGSGEAENAEAETEEEAQEVSEPEAQDSGEQQAESKATEEPVDEKYTNRITRQESEEGETTTTSESKETHEPRTSKASLEAAESEEDVEEQPEKHMTETAEPESESLEKEPEYAPESIDEPDSEPVSPEVTDAEEESVEHESPEQEMLDDPEVQTEEAQEPSENEPLPETLDDFVERVKDLLDEMTEEDDAYDYVQDPLTGETQRVPKILAEYEDDEQKQRRKNRNLFAELSEEERERFKELVREEAESEDERSAETVEKAWGQVVERAEQEREELLEGVREVLEDMSDAEEHKRSQTSIESDDDDEVDEEEQFLTQGESRLRIWIPRVNGERIESVERLEELVREQYPGLLKHKKYRQYIRQAKLHLELVERFQMEDLKRGDIARISRETGQFPTTVKRWLIEGTKPRVYHYLTRNPLDNREERVASLLSSLNSVTDMKTLEKRLRTLFLYGALEASKGHAENLERAQLFFQFLEEYVQGGILKSLRNRLGIGKNAVTYWLNGSQLPTYVRVAVATPSETPEMGKRWLPLRLNTRTNLPEKFIQVPDAITSEKDLLSVLRQLQSLRTSEMKEFEEKYGGESKALAFMYLLGLIVSDGGFDADSDLSARVVLFASKKYRWSRRLGRAFSYAMGQIGIDVERWTDRTKVRDGKTTVFNVWGSQASPLLRWVKEVLFGLERSDSKKEMPIDAEWILSMSHDYRVAFLQGLADGDGYASIKTFRVGIASKTNQEFIRQLLSNLEIQSSTEKTKVVIKRYEDILKANSLPFFKHATSRKKNHDELCKIISLLDRSYGKIPERERKIIMELLKQGLSPGEVTESLWFDYGIARSRASIEGIVRRQKSD
jgi:hypothetical protein